MLLDSKNRHGMTACGSVETVKCWITHAYAKDTKDSITKKCKVYALYLCQVIDIRKASLRGDMTGIVRSSSPLKSSTFSLHEKLAGPSKPKARAE